MNSIWHDIRYALRGFRRAQAEWTPQLHFDTNEEGEYAFPANFAALAASLQTDR
jgi:hypothetical protein